MIRLEYKKVGSVYQVFLDGEYTGPFYLRQLPDTVMHSAEDAEILVSEGQAEELKKLVKRYAFERYSALTASREIAVSDLRQKMQRAYYPEPIIEETVEKLYQYNFLSDERYVESYIRNYRAGKAKTLLKRELLAKKLDAELIDAALEEVFEEDGVTEEETIRSIFQKKFHGIDLSDERQKRRVFSYFLRRGYSYAVVKNCLT